MKDNIFLIEGCNFEDFPKGGQLSFCTQLLHVFPNKYFNLVGITTNPKDKIGQWNVILIENNIYKFFPVCFVTNTSKKNFMPSRLRFFLSLLRYRKRIFNNKTVYHLFTHAPETLFALNVRNSKFTFLHFLHGVENPLTISRYQWAKYFSDIFWRIYLKKLSHIKYLAATADYENINNFKAINGVENQIVRFPTRFDDTVFTCQNTNKTNVTTFVYCGRINRAKGWELLIESFNVYIRRYKKAMLIIIGDGEDKELLKRYIKENNLEEFVLITGFIDKKGIAEYLNKAHIFLLPSFKEGWPIALVEALGCGLPIVATNVSGVKDMIVPDENGFILDSRDVNSFADLMFKSTSLESPNKKSLEISMDLRQSSLKQSLMLSFPDFFTSIDSNKYVHKVKSYNLVNK